MPASVEPAWPSGLPGPVEQLLREGGFEIAGAVSPGTYDRRAPGSLRTEALLPSARAALVLGAGEAFLHKADRQVPDPLDHHTESLVGQVVEALDEAGHPSVPVFGHVAGADGYLDLVGLGREAGLGWPSRLGMLLHPERGPWWSLRAAVLTTAPLTLASPLPGEGPCTGCPAPCEAQCPGSAPKIGGFDLEACGRVRAVSGPCDHSCAARSACVVGTAHSYSADLMAVLMGEAREALLEAAGLSE